jgi:hypothetical protein
MRRDWREVFRKLSMGFQRFSQSKFETEKIHSYPAELVQFLKDEETIRQYNKYYDSNAVQAEAERETAMAKIQGQATGSLLSKLGG